jgi:acetylornithine/succinyldiaminopimelate/putrescine aminotransferase
MDIRSLFLRHVAQTSDAPIGLHIDNASGCYLYDADGNQYLDLIGGISVCNIGHGHQAVKDAVHAQVEKYMHVMVYGEVVQSPQVQYASLLTNNLPPKLDCVYFTNSGTEATEGAIKLARRATGKTDIVACNKSYHGATLGALSMMGDEYWRNAFRPLMPGVWHHDYNSDAFINAINEHTACVIIETIQAESGITPASADWLQRIRKKCDETGALLIMDEIQCGFGRTGKLWAFEHYSVVPDILLLGKALGGGMPLGAFVAAHSTMQLFTHQPVLGHITTFGGHPVSCAAGMAAMYVLLQDDIIDTVAEKEKLFRQLLVHPAIKSVRSKGLLMAVELENQQAVLNTLQRCLQNGLFSDWFLFAASCIRIAPPLTITKDEIQKAVSVLLKCL